MRMRLLTFSILSVLLGYGLSQNGDIPTGASSLAFVFDITGSMYDDLLQVIEGARKIMAVTLARRVNPLYNYILVPFHDPDIGPVIVTTDPEEFVNELRDLVVYGGGDCPEMSVGAIREALNIALPNSYIYVFTDARSKDFVLTDDVLALIQQKQSQVVFVLTGDCGNHTHSGFQAYERIASTSSGQVFLLKKDQVNEVLEFVKLTVQAQKVNLMSVDNPGQSVNTYYLPVDNKLEEFTVSVSGKEPDIKLWSPGTDEEFTEDKGLRKLLDLKKVQIKNVRDPEPGKWKLQVSSNSSHTVRVHGLSSANFVSGFSRKPDAHISSTTLRPLAGVESHVLVNTSDMMPPTDLYQLKLLDLHGQVLAQYPLERHSLKDQIYRVKPFTPPDTFFYIQISGTDSDGNVLQRLTPTAISTREPTRPTVYMPDMTRGYYESTAFLTCEVISEIPFTVQWSRTGRSQGYDHGYSDSTNVTLEVPNATERSEGLYMCNATNTAGWRATQTFLDVSEPPPSVIPPSNVSVLPDEDAMLTCFVYSTVEHNITWYKVGRNSQIKSNRKYQILNNGSLIVRDIKVEDDGKYVCRVGNEGGFTKESLFLIVQVPPEVQINPKKQEFQEGKKVSFHCEGSGLPEPKYYWMRDGALLIPTDRIRIRAGTLVIRDLVRADEGSYQCLARNPAGESVAVAELVYIEKPEITLYEPEIIVAAGDTAVLKCSTTGIPPPIITWHKGDNQITSLSYVKITDDGQLTILGTQAQDAGKYRCIVSNSAGSTSATTQLTVGSDPRMVSPPQNTGADLGTNATLTCRASGLPTPDIQWLANGKPVSSDGRLSQMPGGALFILGIKPEDEGTYTCIAKNRFGVSQHEAYLTVTGMFRPVLSYTVPLIEVIAGTEVSLDCNPVQGNPKPTIRWLWKGRPVNNTWVEQTSGSLTIPEVQREHAGDYMCVASNVVGNTTSVVTVNVQSPPSLSTSNPGNQQTQFTVNQGDGIVIPCSVEGDPRPHIQWFKDDSPISVTDLHYFVRQDGSLQIFSSDTEDTGHYKCQASNVAGSVEKTVSLDVRVPPTIEGDLNEDTTVNLGKTLNLKCLASGVPKPNVVWTKDSKPFNPKSDRFIFSEFGLTITNVKKGDEAEYKCVVTNAAGEITKLMIVNVQSPPKISKGENSSSTNVAVTKGASTTLNCEVRGDPLPVVTWYKDGVILDTDMVKYELLETGSLVLRDVTVEDGGEYVCEAENDAGSDSKGFTLNVKVPPEITVDLPNKAEVVENNPVSLVCPVTGSPPPSFTWYKDGVIIDDSNEGYVLTEDGTLNVINADETNEGLYKCVATNDVGSVEREVTLDVHVKPKLTNTSFGSDRNERPIALVNNNITLICPIDADPLPKFTWYKNGLQIAKIDNSVSLDGKTLTILNAMVRDAGRYTCEAENIAGKTNMTFNLDVHVPPHIDRTAVSPDHMIVVRRRPLVINCPISGTPLPKITWYIDGETVAPSNHIILSVQGRQLTIMNSSLADAGQYVCRGKNSAGTKEKTFDVEVHVPANVNNAGVIDQPEVAEGGTVQLTCPAVGFPPPKITWFINNQPIRDNTDKLMLLDNGWTLEIRNATSEDSGRYRCRAQNQEGMNSKEFDLNILLASKIPRTKLDLSPTLILGRGLMLACPATGYPPPSITWYKDDEPIDFTLPSLYKTTSQGRKLFILSATESAVFRCHARNKVGEDQVEFDLQVLLPAVVNRTGINTSPKVQSGDQLTLHCPASGIPPPLITWYKDDGNLNVTEPQLTIDAISVEDAGSYKCVVENEAGKSELIFDVKVHDPPVINSNDVITDPKVILGKPHTMTCHATGNPPPTIVWYKNGKEVDDQSDSNIEIRSEGRQFHIKVVDVKDQGQYTCSASNEAGLTDLNFDLDVLVPPSIDDSFGSHTTSVENGHSTTLYCPVSGNPTPSVQWYIDGRALTSSGRLLMEDGGQKLTITKSHIQDAGNYTCVASNEAGETSQDYQLQVLVPPFIDESNLIYNPKINVNRTILIDCPVEGVPLPEVTWFVNSVPLQESERHILLHKRRQLKVVHVQVEDSGIYTCQAVNQAGSLNKNFKLTVHIPAKVDSTNLKRDFFVVQNGTVYIDCPVSGTPQPSIMWLKDTIPLLEFPYKDLRVLNQGQRLEVSNAQLEDAGRYTCDVSNIAGSDKQVFELEVRVPPKLVEPTTTSQSSVVVGQSVNLECLVEGAPKPDVVWLKDNEPLDIDSNPNIRVMAGGQVLQFITGQEKDKGRYTCRAKNSAGVVEKYFDLIVNVPPKINGSDTVQKEFVILNQQHVLDCPASGFPPPTITWKYKDDVIPMFGTPSHRILDRGRQLLLINTQLLDAGLYTCTVSNVAGSSSLEFQVQVLMPPTITEGPRHVAGEVDTRVRLQCEADGLPKPKVTWLKNGQPFPATELRHTMLSTGSLEFVSVQIEDSGNYTCLVSNQAGNLTRKIRLDAQVRPKMRNRGPVEVYVSRKESADIPCEVDAYPPPSIIWQFGASILAEYPGNPDDRRFYNSNFQIIDNSTLRIKNVSDSDAGTYICIARNNAGTAIGHYRVIVTVPPKILVSRTDFIVSHGHDITLPCTWEGHPLPQVTWKKNGMLISPDDFHFRILDSGALVIPYSRPVDAGTYTCQVENKYGKDSVNLNLLVEVPPTITRDASLLTSSVGDTINMPCEAYGIPEPAIQWYKDSRQISNESLRHNIDVNGTLTVFNLQAGDTGTYTCIARNVAGRDHFDRTLRVQVPPSIIQSPLNMEVVANDRFMLKCRATGIPVPNIYWKRNGELLRTRPSYRGRSRLMIRNAAKDDAGVYSCVARNPAGQVEVFATVSLKEPPEVLVIDEDIIGTMNEDVVLTCSVTGSPPPNVYWTKNGRPLQLHSRIEQTDTGSLLIHNAKNSDSGDYKCVATNEAGSSDGLVSLLIQGPPTITTKPTDTHVEEGDITIFNCKAEGEPQPQVKWYKLDGGLTEISTEDRLSILPNNSLRMISSQLSDSGVYRCLAGNVLGYTSETANLTVVVHGGFSLWSDWGPCSRSCGTGNQVRSRDCSNPQPANGGKGCNGLPEESRLCSTQECPVNGGWSQWGAFSVCSATCNGGTKVRLRTCTDPAPRWGGKDCEGPNNDQTPCNTDPCPVPGQWSDWGTWSECSTSCDEGYKDRYRVCNTPLYGGLPCVGDREEKTQCTVKPCYRVPTRAEGNLVGYINNVDIAEGKINAEATPGPDGTMINATLDNLPPEISGHLQHLISVLNPVYWTLSQEVDGAGNGYRLTDGKYNRETQVQFATGEILKMNHYVKGVDSSGVLQYDVILSGYVPSLPENSNIHLYPYTEDYIQTAPDTLYSHSSRLMRVNGHMLPYAWNHTVSYDRSHGVMPFLVEKLTTKNIQVSRDASGRQVHFSFVSEISRGSSGEECPAGFILNRQESYCLDEDECITVRPCSHYCHNSPGSYSCSCNPGFTLDRSGQICQDVDECATNNGGCGSDNQCINIDGSFICAVICKEGYRTAENGNKCVDIDECRETPEICGQACQNFPGGYQCSCREGFQLRNDDSGRCTDINECSTGLSMCSHMCMNTIGTYRCDCPTGMRLFGQHTCEDIDECREGRHNCGPGEGCINTRGSYECRARCHVGYQQQRDGSCIDENECLTNRHRCYSNQRCVNTEGSYYCQCQQGYRSRGPGQPCLDIDECVEDVGVCQHNCTNTIGSFMCTCPLGYRVARDGRKCVDINECLEQNIRCGPEKMCFNQRGDFSCIDTPCPRKYRRDPVTNYCVLECVDSTIPCPPHAKFADVIEFRTLALPSGHLTYQDLIRLSAYDHLNVKLYSNFTILENDPKINFLLRPVDGSGIVYTLQPLVEKTTYKIKVSARSLELRRNSLRYQTTFIIHISVSAFPY